MRLKRCVFCQRVLPIYMFSLHKVRGTYQDRCIQCKRKYDRSGQSMIRERKNKEILRELRKDGVI